MILTGCLAIVSGVLVAALYNNDKTKPVPRWLRKIFKCTSSAKTHSKNSVKRDQSTTPIRSNTLPLMTKEHTSLGAASNDISPTDEYCDGYTERICDENHCSQKHQDDLNDQINDWQEIASAVDKLMLSIATVLTIGAIAVTVALFMIESE